MSDRVANVLGLGLIGGSVALALSERGWYVHGTDVDDTRVAVARERGIIHEAGLAAEAAVTFVAVPPKALRAEVERALRDTTGVVTDVGSVKTALARAVTDSRFVAGHPMAGSELDGLDGADAEMFVGAVWVLTPTANTSDDAFATVAAAVSELGAEVVGLEPERHDSLVAVVSHVPHLTAATLMRLAGSRAEEHIALLRLAAGGFRDMTRIASGQPGIWLDICDENRDAIVAALDALIGDWHGLGLPLLACGMVGSQHGWRELPYALCPAGADGGDGLGLVFHAAGEHLAGHRGAVGG